MTYYFCIDVSESDVSESSGSNLTVIIIGVIAALTVVALIIFSLGVIALLIKHNGIAKL